MQQRTEERLSPINLQKYFGDSENIPIFAIHSEEMISSFKGFAEIAQLVEHNLAKVGVASSSLVFRSREVIRNDGLFLFVSMGYVAPTKL